MLREYRQSPAVGVSARMPDAAFYVDFTVGDAGVYAVWTAVRSLGPMRLIELNCEIVMKL